MFSLAHLSDVHLGPLPSVALRDLMSKRMLGYANWRRSRSHHHRAEILAAIVEHIRRQSPDHIAVTGDLVNIALPAEFEAAREWLDRLGPPERVSVVPGNHDAYVTLPAGSGFENWASYMTSDGTETGNVEFPYVRRSGDVSLIGASSAVPAPIFKAFGRLGAPQIAALAAMLADEGGAGRYRILMIHHPPHPEGTRTRKRLTDSSALLEMLRQTGVELVIFGHNHKFNLSWHEGPDGMFPSVGVPSGSAAVTRPGEEGGYHLFQISDDTGVRRARLIRFAADRSGVVRQIGEPVSLGGDDQTTVAAILKASAPHG